MELRKLKSFLVVAKELHFGKAAQKLNITQPALTSQIQQLENDLGYELFNKIKRVQNRKVELTDQGIFLVKEVSRIIDQLDRTLKNAKDASEKSRRLTLGISKMCRTDEVVKFIRFLQDKSPHYNFRIMEYSTSISVQEELFKGNIDIGITALPLVFKNLEYTILKKELLSVIMLKGHPLAKYQKIKIEQLRNDKWVEFNKDYYPAFLHDAELYCKNSGFSREANIVQEVSNIDLLIGSVKAGIGIAFLLSNNTEKFSGLVSKDLSFSNDRPIEVTKIIAYKESLKTQNKEIYERLLELNENTEIKN